MMWTPACQTLSTVQGVALSSMLLKIQSRSPFGPPTNPSTETDIFSTNFLIVFAPLAID